MIKILYKLLNLIITIFKTVKAGTESAGASAGRRRICDTLYNQKCIKTFIVRSVASAARRTDRRPYVDGTSAGASAARRPDPADLASDRCDHFDPSAGSCRWRHGSDSLEIPYMNGNSKRNRWRSGSEIHYNKIRNEL